MRVYPINLLFGRARWSLYVAEGESGEGFTAPDSRAIAENNGFGAWNRVRFESREAAVEYAESRGWEIVAGS